ncbi:MAG: copper resistance protein CopC, partial [Chloroflexia bacterium]|nr:copper resistance protein CopC [Chloroflexia bacterium]
MPVRCPHGAPGVVALLYFYPLGVADGVGYSVLFWSETGRPHRVAPTWWRKFGHRAAFFRDGGPDSLEAAGIFRGMNGRRCSLAGLLLLALAIGALIPGRVDAHATLVRADPPVDGLVAASPAQLRLVFSEEIYVGEGPPSIQLLDEAGNGKGLSPVGSGVRPDRPREVLVNIGDLDPGTYTVVWSVRSATDGHTLSGTYAFRV